MTKRIGFIPLGQFDVTGGRVMVTDPCYDRGTWCQGTLPARDGRWAAEMQVGNRPGWGRRVHVLRAFHVDVPPQGFLRHADFKVGVDSGQAGIFDEARYPQDDPGDYDDLESFYGRACSATHDRDDEESEGRLGGVITEGAVSSSGLGDGSYNCYYRTDEEGRAVEVEIVFIGDGDEEEEEDEEEKESPCRGCGCQPGEGVTDGCMHPDGCGYWKALYPERTVKV